MGKRVSLFSGTETSLEENGGKCGEDMDKQQISFRVNDTINTTVQCCSIAAGAACFYGFLFRQKKICFPF